MPNVNPIYIPGKLCPQCGRPLQYIAAPNGGRIDLIVPTPERVSPTSRQRERVVSKTSYEAKTVKEWVTHCNAICSRCDIVLNSADGIDGVPEPDKMPRGYWLPEPQSVSTLCQCEGESPDARTDVDTLADAHIPSTQNAA